MALLAVYLPIHLAHIGPKGFGLAKSLFPTGSAEFLRRTHPRPQLYNDRYYGWGNYLIDALPEYPVSVDSREDLMAEYWKQYAEVDQPERQAAFLDRLGANIALMPLPREGGFASATALRRWYPVEQWALVYFENNAVVLVRRIPEHAKLIAEHEYVHLVPGQRPAQMRSDALPELERCLAETPENIHCLYSKANLLIEEGRRSEARVYLERAAQWQKHL